MNSQQLIEKKLEITNHKEKFNEISKKLYLLAENIKDKNLKEILLDLLSESNKARASGDCCIFQINDCLECAFDSLLSAKKIQQPSTAQADIKEHQKNVKKIVSYSNDVSGKGSLKTKAFGVALMALATFLILLSALPIIFGVVNLPGVGVDILLGLFGLSPAIAGIAIFKYGYETFDKGRRHGVAKQMRLFAKEIEDPNRGTVLSNVVNFVKEPNLSTIQKLGNVSL